MSPFITADDLYAVHTRGERQIIIDSHWAPQDNASWQAYVSQHIPGAFWCDPQRMLAGTPSPEAGRNPLPNPLMLQKTIADWGISPGFPVRIYDAGRMFWAARAWWILRWAGIRDVQVLIGGTPAWEAAGGDVAGGIGCLRGRGTAVIAPGAMPVIDIDGVADWVDAGNLLIDVRGAGRYLGRREPLDRRAGHVPGAVNIPVELLLETGGVPEPTVVAERLSRRGIGGDGGVPPEKIAVYSGSGVDSSLFLALMDHAGLPGARHFVGGWSQWAGDSRRPVELAV